MQISTSILEQVFFMNIGPYQRDNETFFEWKSSNFYKNTMFEVRLTRNAPFKNIFYCISKSDIKLVYYVKNETVFTIGAHPDVQSLLLEAVLEYLVDIFFDTYDESLLMTCYGDVCNIFDGFKATVLQVFENYRDYDLIKASFVTCKACQKTIQVIIKKSIIENSTKPTTPVVYVHSGHAILVYVDKQFKVRGSELVSVSY